MWQNEGDREHTIDIIRFINGPQSEAAKFVTSSDDDIVFAGDSANE